MFSSLVNSPSNSWGGGASHHHLAPGPSCTSITHSHIHTIKFKIIQWAQRPFFFFFSSYDTLVWFDIAQRKLRSLAVFQFAYTSVPSAASLPSYRRLHAVSGRATSSKHCVLTFNLLAHTSGAAWVYYCNNETHITKKCSTHFSVLSSVITASDIGQWAVICQSSLSRSLSVKYLLLRWILWVRTARRACWFTHRKLVNRILGTLHLT